MLSKMLPKHSYFNLYGIVIGLSDYGYNNAMTIDEKSTDGVR